MDLMRIGSLLGKLCMDADRLTTLYTNTLFLEHEHNRYDESAQVLFDSI